MERVKCFKPIPSTLHLKATRVKKKKESRQVTRIKKTDAMMSLSLFPFPSAVVLLLCVCTLACTYERARFLEVAE